MQILFNIIMGIILPLLILVAVGALLQRKFTLDLKTLSKILTYLLLPVVAFVNIYESDINLNVLFDVLFFQGILSILLMIFSYSVVKLLKLDKGMSAVYKNSVVLINSGNYGIPVSQMIFHQHPLGMTIQIIVMFIQNFITYTYGLMNSVSVHAKGKGAAFGQFLKLPMLYALLLGVVLKALNISIPTVLWQPLENLSDAFLAIALLTLGAQLAYVQLKKFNKLLLLSILGRLFVSPALALGLIFILGLDGIVAQSLFIASSFPSSRNSAQFALEFDHHPELAGQIVLVSTILSSLTVGVVIYVAEVLFG